MAGFGAKVKLTVDKSSKAEFNKQINDMVGQIKVSNKFTVLQKDMDRVRREAQAMLNSKPMTLKVNKIDCSAAVTNVKKQLQTMLSSLSVTNGVNITGLKDFLGTEGVDAAMRSTADAANAAVQKMNDAKRAAAEWAGQMSVLDTVAKGVASAFKSGISGKNMIQDDAEIQRITATYNTWIQKVEELRANRTGDIEALQQEGLAIQRNITALQNKQAEQAKAAAEAERAAAAAESAAQKEEAANQAEIASLKQIASLQERMTRFLSSNSKLGYTDAGNSLRAMLIELESGAEITIERFREMEATFANIRTQATATGSLGRSILDSLSRAYQRFGGWMLITRSLVATIRTIKAMVTNVREIDSALTQLQIVTGATDTQLEAFLKNATVLAKDLGQSIKDVLGSIETFSRLGYNLEDATELARYANVMANVAAVDTEAATTGMTSIIKGFNMDVTEAEHVADVLVEVGQKYAVSASEMMEAYEKSGAALNATNTSFEKSAGLIAAANASVQNASTVGTALKTISARIRGATADLEELGEDTEELAQGFSKYAKEIKALTGFDIMVDGLSDTYKDIYDIFEGISQVWDKLSDTQQARVAEILGGTRQLQVISSILGNWEDAANAYADAMNSAGVASEANATYMDTITAKLGQFKAAFEELSNAFISSGFVKGLVDFGTGFLNTLTAIIERLGSLPALITAITAAVTIFRGAKGFGSGFFGFDGTQIVLINNTLNTMIKNFGDARNAGMGFISSLRSSFGGFWAGASRDIAEYNRLLSSSSQTQGIFMKYIGESNSSLASYLNSLNGSKASLAGYQAYCKQAGVSAQGLGVSSKLAAVGVTALNVAINMLISLGITLLIQGIILAFQEWHKSTKELVEASNELKESFAEFKRQSEDNIKTIESLRSEFDKLSDGVDRYGRNISLSADDYDRYKQIVEKVVELSPELIEGYDKENGYLVDKNNLLERAIELQNQEYKNELRSIATTPKLEEAMAGSVATYSDLLSGDALTSNTDLKNSIYRMFNINNRKNLPKGTDISEQLAREIMDALGVKNIDNEIEKYFNDYGYYQADWFFKDYIDRIAEDLQDSHSRIIRSLDFEDLEFDSDGKLDVAIEEARDAASAYGDVRKQLANANQDIADQLLHIAESNDKFMDLSENGKKVVENFVNTFGVEDVTKDGYFGGKVLDENAINHVRVQINDFIDKFTPEIQEMVDKGLSLKLGIDVDGNGLSVKEYQSQVKKFLHDIEDIEDEDLKLYIRTSLDIDEDATTLNAEIEKAITHVKNLLVDTPIDKSELEKLLAWYRQEVSEAEELGVDLSKTVYGNIDTNNRQIIEWTEDNIEKYRDVINSWKDSNEDLDDVIDNMRDTISTVMGTTENFDGVDIAFSPILQTEDGPVYLDKDTLSKYINDLIAKAGNNWTADDLLRLDVEGIEYDGMRIRNMLADIGKTAEQTSEAMYFTGDLGSIALAYDDLKEAALNAGMTIEELNEAIESGDITKLRTVQEIVDDLSVDKALHIYYNISADPHSMTFDELMTKLELLDIDWSKTIDVWDFSPMVNSLGEIESKITDVVSAMNSLQNGTKLTVEEMAKLALKYPELLKASNLFTDTSIENQKTLLDSILGTYESEYDALVDTKIAELTATNELIKSQIELENEKKDKVIEIADLQSNGKLDSEREYQKLLDELHDLEGQNFVTYSDGVLSVNEDMLTKMLENEGESVDESKPIWGALGDMIIEGHTDGLSGALKAFPQYLTKLKDWAGSSLKTLLSNIGTNIKKAFAGENDFVKLTDGIGNLGSVSVGGVTIETTIEGNYKIDDKSVDEWAAGYKDVIEKRINTLTEQISANEAIIDNLKRLKGLDLKSLYSSGTGKGSSSKSSEKEIEEYIADIDAYYEALKRLESIQIRLSALENGLEFADTDREKIGLTKQLIDVYNDEIDALDTLNNLRKDTIQNSIGDLEALGFEVEYSRETNEFIVRNLEHLNELEGKTLEETNELRKGTEELIDTLDDLNEANQDGVDSIRSYRKEIKEAKQDIIDYLHDIVAAASDAVDEIQNVYDTLKSAADEYAENGGFISVDAYQKIVDLGPQYMQYLEDENGLLVINEENINRVIAAKTEQLALENALSYVERLRLALEEDSIEDLNQLLYATTQATDATWGLVYANLALLDLDADQYNAALHNINSLRSLADTAIDGIGRVAGEAASAAEEAAKAAKKELENLRDELEDMQDAGNDLIKYVMDMLKHRIQQQIDALNEMKDAYSEIIDLKKKSLQATKDENNYQKSVAEKVKEMAKLQAKIDALSLDNSRDAQAQRAALMEELAALQEELADEQADYALDATTDALDDMEEAYHKEKDREIEILEETISSYQKLYDMAIQYIEEHWDTLYSELISWNYEYGSVLNSEITDAWNKCLEAAQRYGSFVDAMLGGIEAEIARINAEIESINLSSSSSSKSSSSSSNNTVVGNTKSYEEDYTTGYVAKISDLVAQMRANASKWQSADETERSRLHANSVSLASQISKLGVTASYDPGSGTWTIVSDKWNPSFVGRPLLSSYHTGGIAGDNPTLKQKEMLAILEKGEAILDKKKESALYHIIDFNSALSEKLNKAIGSIGVSGISNIAKNSVDTTHAPLPAVTNNQSEAIHFGDVYIYGADGDTVRQHQEINRKFTNEILSQLRIKR